MPDTPISPSLDHQIALFQERHRDYETLKAVLLSTLNRACQSISGVEFIQGRVKSVESFADKCQRKAEKYHYPACQLTDLCGIRVIVLTGEHIQDVCRRIEALFVIHEKEDKFSLLQDMEFGYRSLHYIISLDAARRERYSLEDKPIPDTLFARYGGGEIPEPNLLVGPVYKAEIQVRTLLQHAWAAAVHDSLYKTEIKKVPSHLKREAARISALLEAVDGAMERMLHGVDAYRSDYGAYMTAAEMREAYNSQQTLLRQLPGNRNSLLKMARLAAQLREPEFTADLRGRLESLPGSGDAEVLRELGKAHWILGERTRGLDLVREAAKKAPLDVENWCELGGMCHANKAYGEALAAYEKAFAIAPRSPRVLTGLLKSRILSDGGTAFLPLLRHAMEEAIAASQQKIDAGMDLPWAWFDIGLLRLLLGDGYGSLDAYGKGFLGTVAVEPVAGLGEELTALRDTLARGGDPLAASFAWVAALFEVVLAGRFGWTAQREALMAAKRRVFVSDEPVVIVAGTCEQGSEQDLRDYAPLLEWAFAGFAGTVCCGGTEAGVSKLVGDLPDNGGRLKKVAYLPPRHPKTDREHPAYTLVRTTDGSYGPLDPLALWGDMLTGGIEPGRVRLLGIGGGELSAFEYRLAMLLGARVGLVADSGGSARELLGDPAWTGAASVGLSPGYGSAAIVRLPVDRETWRAFVQPAGPAICLAPADRERLARQSHEEYLAIQGPKAARVHPELEAWERLDQAFRDANLSQVDWLEALFRRAGLTLRKVARDAPVVFAPTDELVEELAEMEHGRWVVERLLAGWTWGPVRNNDRKQRPQLVPWSALSEEEKDKDRSAVRTNIANLQVAGYAIRPAGDD